MPNENINLVKHICDICSDKGCHKQPRDLISFISDRPGHDKRYAINYTKLKKELHWNPEFNFSDALSITIDWYINKLVS